MALQIKPKRKAISPVVENITKNTTIHGLYIVGLPNIHLIERIIWLIIIGIALGGAIAVALSNWRRYAANPTVVSLQKDFRNWLNPFPAATGCFIDKTDERKAQKFIKEKWGLVPTDLNYDNYMDFVKTVANISYHNLHEFERFKNNPVLNSANMLEVAGNVHPLLSGTLVTFDTKRKTNWQLVITELGICFSVNSKFENLLSFKIPGDITKQSNTDQTILRCHYLNGLCYARYDSDPQKPLKYYVHSYLDVVHATSESPLHIRESEELEINYRMQETLASPGLRKLTPSQRRCRFDDEPIHRDFPVYSTSICYIGCRYNLAMQLCGCKPFFYNFLDGKECDIEGLVCLSKYADNITKPPSEIGCNCPQPCDIITYLPQKPKYTKWEHGYFDQRITFRWGLLPPTTKYHRDVIFGLENLVVSLGGTVALFLGISTMSVIEIIFLILESFCTWYKNKRGSNKMQKPKNQITLRQFPGKNIHLKKYYSTSNYHGLTHYQKSYYNQ
ncbi:sodium channel protein Nach-like [Aethina tumida]|uniref:sodium channel protein Nach-like n=1 Tax=Aethina tumida TaxID=116153 RepID=UPI002147311E|nr:sodium channel protein Nach-like [Aethina tumida]